MASKPILTNTILTIMFWQIPKKTKKRSTNVTNMIWWCILMTLSSSSLHLTLGYFQQVQVINFYIINHECRGTPLQNSEQYYKTIQKKTLTIMKIIFKLRPYHPLLNLNAIIFILNMIFLGNILRKKLILKVFGI